MRAVGGCCARGGSHRLLRGRALSGAECGLVHAALGPVSYTHLSEVHANFIVNTGDATARDVLELINLVKTKVYETYGIELQPEVRFLGFA